MTEEDWEKKREKDTVRERGGGGMKRTDKDFRGFHSLVTPHPTPHRSPPHPLFTRHTQDWYHNKGGSEKKKVREGGGGGDEEDSGGFHSLVTPHPTPHLSPPRPLFARPSYPGK